MKLNRNDDYANIVLFKLNQLLVEHSHLGPTPTALPFKLPSTFLVKVSMLNSILPIIQSL